MTTRGVNDVVTDHMVAHQVGLLRLDRGVVRQLLAILLKSRENLTEELTRRLAVSGGLEGDADAFTRSRLAAQLRDLEPIIAAAHRGVGERLEAELAAIAQHEVAYQLSLFEEVLPFKFSWTAPGVEQLEALVTSLPFEGQLLRDYVSALARSQFAMVSQAVQEGIVEGRTLDQLVRRAVGSSKRPAGGAAYGQVYRSQLEAVVRTSVNHVASQSRDALYRGNTDVIKGWSFLAVLDARVTLVCAAEDGKTYKLGEGRKPPLHYGCRSVTIPVIRSFEELARRGVEVELQHRAALDGQAAARITYPKWLQRQPAEMQDFVLGPTRAKLFRSGQVTIDRFIDSRGRSLMLRELAALEGLAR